MPKELFYALPEEKRQRILDAAVQEFSCAEYHSASINQIIKTADIARGSFYLYFEDKRDLYIFLVEQVFRTRLKAFTQQVAGQKFTTLRAFHDALFSFNLNMLHDERYNALFCNLYISMEYSFSREMRMVAAQIRQDMLSALPFLTETAEQAERTDAQLELLQLLTHALLVSKVLEKRDDADVIQEYRRKASIIC